MFRLYHSNDLEILKELLLNEIRQNPPGVFDAEQILVQSQGMAHWLKLQLADGLGVAAQVDFPLPSAYVWKVFNTLKPELPERSHFEKQAMAWKLMRLLPGMKGEPQCEGIARYLDNDPDGLRCYELAHKVADVFDQYLVYRPDWLLNWEKGVDEIDDSDVSVHPWQPLVWRALVADSQRLGNSLEHRARLTTSLESIVAENGDRLKAMPKRLFVFGIAALPGGYWDVLNAISGHIDVHFFLLNPCRNFWGDIVSDRQRAWILKTNPDAESYLERGNPLLASWGRLGKDFLTLVHETSDEGRLQDIEAFADIERTSLLKHIQADLLDLHDRQLPAYQPQALKNSLFKSSILKDDASLRIVSGHSPLREVQRLHDQLLFWFNENPSLKPRDVVVMVPDIDQYAPYIDAVFASAPEGHRIPWAIADQSQVQENPLLDSVVSLMSLFDSRIQLTDVLDWLDVPAIRRRFSIEEGDLEGLREWLNQAGVRWGLDGDHRSALGFPEFSQNSWRKGLRQLLLGLMLPTDATAHQGDDWPVFGVEGGAAELLGQLIQLIETLDHWREFQSEAHSVDEWMLAIPELLDDFYEPDLDEGVQLQRVRDAIQRWSEELNDAAYDDTLSPLVVRSWFQEHLGQQGGWQRFLAGPVNFCTLMPMRSIPFKAVCLLGMNDQDYPRQVTPVGFDLMVQGRARRGDRSRREDDRYLVLEALCSAQDRFYISYRGRDARENHELQPSVLVSELMDYVGDAYCLEGDEKLPARDSRERLRDWLIEELPLQPFNRRTYEPEKENESEQSNAVAGYHKLWADVANADHSNTKNRPFYSEPVAIPEGFSRKQILWSDVKESLLKPAGFFLKRRLKLQPDLYMTQSRNEEIFQPDALENSQLKQRWMQDQLANVSAEIPDFTYREQALGSLPVNALGDIYVSRVEQELAPLLADVKRFISGDADSGALTLVVSDPQATDVNNSTVEISGEYAQCWNHQLVYWRAGDLRGEHLLNLWLDFVFAIAAQPGLVDMAVIVGGKKKSEEIIFNAPSQEEAIHYVQQCLMHYFSSWTSPQTALPGVQWALLRADEAKRMDTVKKQAESEFSEFNRTAMQRCHPDLAATLLAGGLDDWLESHRWIWALPEQYLQQSSNQEAGA